MKSTILLRKIFRHLAVVAVFGMVCSIPLSVLSADSHEDGAQKAVLVTGSSSGIGQDITIRLAAEGYFVYATARKQEDLDALNALDNVQAIRLDVTSQEDIDAAVKTVTEAGRGLHGVVNNAGVAVIGPLIELEEQDLHFQMDVNVYGPYRINKAFAPLIMESKGRMTTIGSISGILAGPLGGAYSMSKHAVEAYTDSLSAEMGRFGVHVSVVEPGNYQSDMGKNVARRMQERGYSSEGSLFEKEMQSFIDLMSQGQGDQKDSDEVSDAVMHALFDDNPYQRYMVVPNEQQADVTIRQALREAVQLNQWHAYKYDRDQLVKILDEVLAE